LLDDEAWTRGARGDSPVGRVRIADCRRRARQARFHPLARRSRRHRIGTGLVWRTGAVRPI